MFDVDFTLWPYWCDTHTHPPFNLQPDGQVKDGRGQILRLYDDVPSILLALRSAGIKIAFASRTHEPKWLEDIARKMRIDGGGRTLWDFADYREIFPGDKIKHFKNISAKSGYPCSNMLFFDDESRNRNVTKLGVTFVDAEGGVTVDMVREGLCDYQKQRS